jgi:hypothetical protein
VPFQRVQIAADRLRRDLEQLRDIVDVDAPDCAGTVDEPPLSLHRVHIDLPVSAWFSPEVSGCASFLLLP